MLPYQTISCPWPSAKGQNARLAYKLTGYRIDIRSQSELDELGIDWRGYVEEMHREYEEKKARERAYKQQKRIEELQNSNEPTANIADVADYDYDVDYDDRHLDRMDTLASREAQYESEAEPANEAPKTAESSVSVKEKELDEMEEAARIAKEKRKSLSEKRTTYVSKFESAAEAPKAEPAKPAKPSKGKDDAKKKKTSAARNARNRPSTYFIRFTPMKSSLKSKTTKSKKKKIVTATISTTKITIPTTKNKRIASSSENLHRPVFQGQHRLFLFKTCVSV
ncbi:hypothetical protein [Allobaculum sp. Allo2]|uniref:hypothetical protein n=1 Tax=Allobaculum sp. Allo2 TaxID=2853432 RepID=UPI001F623E52|nr:hypothetical protein [Allobaculum sp. Allo2]UNT92535.1 hypothetical protein KWG61_10285 [Allobaculum sp. Allo2]